MRKFRVSTFEDPPKSPRSRLGLYLVIVVLVLLSPVVWESARLCFASWQGLFGAAPRIQTPVLDALNGGFLTVSSDARRWVRGIFHQTPWKSSYVIPLAICWTAALSLLMRRG